VAGRTQWRCPCFSTVRAGEHVGRSRADGCHPTVGSGRPQLRRDNSRRDPHRRPLTIALVVFALALVIHGLADGGSSRSLRELLAKCVTEDRVGLRCGFPRAPMVGGQGRCPSSGRRRDGGDCVENGLTGRCGARTQWRDAAHRDGVARILRRRADPGQGPVRASHPHAAARAPAGRADVGNL